MKKVAKSNRSLTKFEQSTKAKAEASSGKKISKNVAARTKVAQQTKHANYYTQNKLQKTLITMKNRNSNAQKKISRAKIT